VTTREMLAPRGCECAPAEPHTLDSDELQWRNSDLARNPDDGRRNRGALRGVPCLTLIGLAREGRHKGASCFGRKRGVWSVEDRKRSDSRGEQGVSSALARTTDPSYYVPFGRGIDIPLRPLSLRGAGRPPRRYRFAAECGRGRFRPHQFRSSSFAGAPRTVTSRSHSGESGRPAPPCFPRKAGRLAAASETFDRRGMQEPGDRPRWLPNVVRSGRASRTGSRALALGRNRALAARRSVRAVPVAAGRTRALLLATRGWVAIRCSTPTFACASREGGPDRFRRGDDRRSASQVFIRTSCRSMCRW
jgi:hypothetical protein